MQSPNPWQDEFSIQQQLYAQRAGSASGSSWSGQVQQPLNSAFDPWQSEFNLQRQMLYDMGMMDNVDGRVYLLAPALVLGTGAAVIGGPVALGAAGAAAKAAPAATANAYWYGRLIAAMNPGAATAAAFGAGSVAGQGASYALQSSPGTRSLTGFYEYFSLESTVSSMIGGGVLGQASSFLNRAQLAGLMGTWNYLTSIAEGGSALEGTFNASLGAVGVSFSKYTDTLLKDVIIEILENVAAGQFSDFLNRNTNSQCKVS